MLAWLSKNIATIIICLVLAVIVALIIYNLVKDKKKGKSAKGQKAQLISTAEQKKGRSANCVLFGISRWIFPRFADIIKENRHIGGA